MGKNNVAATLKNPRQSNAGLVTRAQLERIEEVFQRMDVDETGALCYQEVCMLWSGIFTELPKDDIEIEVQNIWRDLDRTGDNEVSISELLRYITGMEHILDGDIEELFEIPIHHRVGQPNTTREWIWAICEPSAAESYNVRWLHNLGLAVTIVSQCAIIGSIILMVVESLPEFQNESSKPGTDLSFILEHICMGYFTLELVVRAFSNPDHRRFWFNGWTMIDLLSILPYYLELTGSLDEGSNAESLVVLRVLRMARLVRVLRVIKLGRHFEGVQILVVALQRSSFALTWLAAIMLMATTLFASLMYSMEKEDATFNFTVNKWIRNANSSYTDAGNPIFMQSIPDAMWWAMVTLTTVGYGDVYPVTTMGKLIGSCTMFVGVLVVAFPVTILCNVFQEVYTEFLDAKKAKQLKADLQPKLATTFLSPSITDIESPRTNPLSQICDERVSHSTDDSEILDNLSEGRQRTGPRKPVFTKKRPQKLNNTSTPTKSLAAIKAEDSSGSIKTRPFLSPTVNSNDMQLELDVKEMKNEIAEIKQLLSSLVVAMNHPPHPLQVE
eukprot:TRINITY_DN31070_c0_g1_i1.p1 TRINITY_DN31070_c0_g1~~TRINITY_DN31070_c0_g1_i1.p1  ORF type:complete len:556 (+),score=53.06 TRINITY_DN31070_c0_g1_i1:61-1728(+)